MAEVSAAELTTAATQLMRGGNWTVAMNLLGAVATHDRAEQRALKHTLAEIAVDQDFWQRTDHASQALHELETAIERLPDATTSNGVDEDAAGRDVDVPARPATSRPVTETDLVAEGDRYRWDLGMLRLRKDYATELSADIGPGGRDATTTRTLAQRVADLRAQAPDDARRGQAAFYAGVISDNLLDDSETAISHYTAALELGERAGDELLISYAVRHLGYHAYATGDLKLAREQWERSTELRQKAGHVPGALAQQALIVTLIRAEGDTAGTQTLTTEINRWSRQLNIPFLIQETTTPAN
ncbi:hypothetical protein EV646_102567 [Kribbella antiqua]|uniref:Tetratricopeptide repeat protein n=1 Tax=Kribbella antiqua TaxID=2512217 RepID=A0A4R2IXH8_9ACTN|nr:hypothetical protein [Kribbella antiqua]TCO50493.1 hypothetical protein EV646_102567 [Kribbella antiqua]